MTELLYVLAGILPLAVVSILTRRFFFRHMAIGTKRNCFAIAAAWPIMTVAGSLAVGGGGIVQRLQNVPDPNMAILYGISAVVLIVLVVIAAAVGGPLSEKPDA